MPGRGIFDERERRFLESRELGDGAYGLDAAAALPILSRREDERRHAQATGKLVWPLPFARVSAETSTF